MFVTIDPVNGAPEEAELHLLVKEGRPSFWQEPIVSDPDAEDTRFSVEVLSSPRYLAVQTDTRRVQVLPEPGWSGVAEFRYRVCDPQRACLDATGVAEVIAAVYGNDESGVSIPLGMPSVRFLTKPFVAVIDETPVAPGVGVEIQPLSLVCGLSVNEKRLLRSGGRAVKAVVGARGRVALSLQPGEDCQEPGVLGSLRVSTPEPFVADHVYPIRLWDPAERIGISQVRGENGEAMLVADALARDCRLGEMKGEVEAAGEGPGPSFQCAVRISVPDADAAVTQLDARTWSLVSGKERVRVQAEVGVLDDAAGGRFVASPTVRLFTLMGGARPE